MRSPPRWVPDWPSTDSAKSRGSARFLGLSRAPGPASARESPPSFRRALRNLPHYNLEILEGARCTPCREREKKSKSEKSGAKNRKRRADTDAYSAPVARPFRAWADSFHNRMAGGGFQ